MTTKPILKPESKKGKRKLKKYLRFLKKDIAKGLGLKKKELFGKQEKIKAVVKFNEEQLREALSQFVRAGWTILPNTVIEDIEFIAADGEPLQVRARVNGDSIDALSHLALSFLGNEQPQPGHSIGFHEEYEQTPIPPADVLTGISWNERLENYIQNCLQTRSHIINAEDCNRVNAIRDRAILTEHEYRTAMHDLRRIFFSFDRHNPRLADRITRDILQEPAAFKLDPKRKRELKWKRAYEVYITNKISPKLSLNNCYGCDEPLSFLHFWRDGYKKGFSAYQLKKMWKSKYIRILCCHCMRAAEEREQRENNPIYTIFNDAVERFDDGP